MRLLFLTILGAVVLVAMAACRQEKPVYLQGCTFCGSKAGQGGYFPDTINRSHFSWDGKVCFAKASFPDSADLTYDNFPDTAVFTYAAFLTSADFSHDSFRRAVYFDDVSFAQETHFDYVKFTGYAKFTNLQATDSVDLQFDDAILPDTLDFSMNPGLKCKIDLTTANFDLPSRLDSTTGGYTRPHGIFLFNSDISKFRLDYFHFRLIVPDSTITPSLGAKHQRITIDQQEAMYEALLNNFKQNGQDESYKLLDIEYKTFKWHHSWAPWLAWVIRIWWNFGYDKEYVFIWISASLLLFTLINLTCLKKLNTQVYQVLEPARIANLRGFRKRVWSSLHYTADVFFRFSLNNENMRFDNPGLTAYFFVIYILGILCLGYLANFILQQ